MKKTKRVLVLLTIIILVICLLPNRVLAKEEKPELKWEQRDFRSDTNYRGIIILCDAGDGYITINNYNEVEKYDYNGNKIKTIIKEYNNGFSTAIIDDGNLLIYGGYNTLYKYSQDGELIFEKKIDVAENAIDIGFVNSPDAYYIGYSYYDNNNKESKNFLIKTDKEGNIIDRYDFNDISLEDFVYDNNQLAIITNDYNKYYLTTMDLNLNIINEKQLLIADESISKIVSIKDGYFVMGNNVLWTGFAKIDKTGNLIWEDENIGTFQDVVETSDGYIAIGFEGVLDRAHPILVKFDKEGNIIYSEEFERFEHYRYYVLDKIILMNNGDYIVQGSIGPDGYRGTYGSIILKYGYKDYNISTNIKGKGTIDINNTAKEGETVTYSITPEEGYQFKSIKVMTQSGKVIETTDNSFIMPDEDVTIELEFVEVLMENPKTGNIIMIITGILLITILGTIVVLYYKRKHKEAD